jgi:hypothetical protein
VTQIDHEHAHDHVVTFAPAGMELFPAADDAHGESVGTSMSQLTAYYKAAPEVVSFVADLVDPPPNATCKRRSRNHPQS